MAFAENGVRNYGLRSASVVRVWNLGGGNGNGTGQYVTAPTNLEFEVFGVFDSGTITIKFSTDGVTYAVLAGATITFTANGIRIAKSTDVVSAYYRPELTATAGATSNLTVVMLALGASDIE